MKQSRDSEEQFPLLFALHLTEGIGAVNLRDAMFLGFLSFVLVADGLRNLC